jgi:transposase
MSTTPSWRAILDRLDLVENALAELDDVIADAFRPWRHQLNLLCTIPGVGVKVAQVIIAETDGADARAPITYSRVCNGLRS